MSTNVLDTVDKIELGKRLKEYRRKHKLTQKAVADELEVKRTTIIAIEQGQRKVKANELLLFAEIYNCDITDLIHTFDYNHEASLAYAGWIKESEGE